jgi:hypothetical protein
VALPCLQWPRQSSNNLFTDAGVFNSRVAATVVVHCHTQPKPGAHNACQLIIGSIHDDALLCSRCLSLDRCSFPYTVDVITSSATPPGQPVRLVVALMPPRVVGADIITSVILTDEEAAKLCKKPQVAAQSGTGFHGNRPVTAQLDSSIKMGQEETWPNHAHASRMRTKQDDHEQVVASSGPAQQQGVQPLGALATTTTKATHQTGALVQAAVLCEKGKAYKAPPAAQQSYEQQPLTSMTSCEVEALHCNVVQGQQQPSLPKADFDIDGMQHVDSVPHGVPDAFRVEASVVLQPAPQGCGQSRPLSSRTAFDDAFDSIQVRSQAAGNASKVGMKCPTRTNTQPANVHGAGQPGQQQPSGYTMASCGMQSGPLHRHDSDLRQGSPFEESSSRSVTVSGFATVGNELEMDTEKPSHLACKEELGEMVGQLRPSECAMPYPGMYPEPRHPLKMHLLLPTKNGSTCSAASDAAHAEADSSSRDPSRELTLQRAAGMGKCSAGATTAKGLGRQSWVQSLVEHCKRRNAQQLMTSELPSHKRQPAKAASSQAAHVQGPWDHFSSHESCAKLACVKTNTVSHEQAHDSCRASGLAWSKPLKCCTSSLEGKPSGELEKQERRVLQTNGEASKELPPMVKREDLATWPTEIPAAPMQKPVRDADNQINIGCAKTLKTCSDSFEAALISKKRSLKELMKQAQDVMLRSTWNQQGTSNASVPATVHLQSDYTSALQSSQPLCENSSIATGKSDHHASTHQVVASLQLQRRSKVQVCRGHALKRRCAEVNTPRNKCTSLDSLPCTKRSSDPYQQVELSVPVKSHKGSSTAGLDENCLCSSQSLKPSQVHALLHPKAATQLSVPPFKSQAICSQKHLDLVHIPSRATIGQPSQSVTVVLRPVHAASSLSTRAPHVSEGKHHHHHFQALQEDNGWCRFLDDSTGNGLVPCNLAAAHVRSPCNGSDESSWATPLLQPSRAQCRIDGACVCQTTPPSSRSITPRLDMKSGSRYASSAQARNVPSCALQPQDSRRPESCFQLRERHPGAALQQTELLSQMPACKPLVEAHGLEEAQPLSGDTKVNCHGIAPLANHSGLCFTDQISVGQSSRGGSNPAECGNTAFEQARTKKALGSLLLWRQPPGKPLQNALPRGIESVQRDAECMESFLTLPAAPTIAKMNVEDVCHDHTAGKQFQIAPTFGAEFMESDACIAPVDGLAHKEACKENAPGAATTDTATHATPCWTEELHMQIGGCNETQMLEQRVPLEASGCKPMASGVRLSHCLPQPTQHCTSLGVGTEHADVLCSLEVTHESLAIKTTDVSDKGPQHQLQDTVAHTEGRTLITSSVGLGCQGELAAVMTEEQGVMQEDKERLSGLMNMCVECRTCALAPTVTAIESASAALFTPEFVAGQLQKRPAHGLEVAEQQNALVAAPVEQSPSPASPLQKTQEGMAATKCMPKVAQLGGIQDRQGFPEQLQSPKIKAVGKASTLAHSQKLEKEGCTSPLQEEEAFENESKEMPDLELQTCNRTSNTENKMGLEYHRHMECSALHQEPQAQLPHFACHASGVTDGTSPKGSKHAGIDIQEHEGSNKGCVDTTEGQLAHLVGAAPRPRACHQSSPERSSSQGHVDAQKRSKLQLHLSTLLALTQQKAISSRGDSNALHIDNSSMLLRMSLQQQAKEPKLSRCDFTGQPRGISQRSCRSEASPYAKENSDIPHIGKLEGHHQTQLGAFEPDALQKSASTRSTKQKCSRNMQQRPNGCMVDKCHLSSTPCTVISKTEDAAAIPDPCDNLHALNAFSGNPIDNSNWDIVHEAASRTCKETTGQKPKTLSCSPLKEPSNLANAEQNDAHTVLASEGVHNMMPSAEKLAHQAKQEGAAPRQDHSFRRLKRPFQIPRKPAVQR